MAERDLNALTGRMLTSSAIALACYGAVLGSFHSPLMALTSAVKLPLLFLVTLAICLPTLYLFNLVFGARLSVRQSLALVMVAITVTSMLAVAFAPISLFFLITAPDYGFFKLLNVAILTLSALVGLRFLTGGMQVLNDHGLLAPEAANAPAPASAAGRRSRPRRPRSRPCRRRRRPARRRPPASGAGRSPCRSGPRWPSRRRRCRDRRAGSGAGAGAVGRAAGGRLVPAGLPPVAQRPWDGRPVRRGEPTQRPPA